MPDLYFEQIGGSAGNMIVGALVDLGADPRAIEAALRTIPVANWTLAIERVQKAGIAATYLDFIVPGEDHHHDLPHDPHPSRHLAEIVAIVDASGLTDAQKTRANAVYRRLAEAEARTHGVDVDAVHFHEVGEVDAILDVAATVVALDLLGVERIAASAYPIGTGLVRMQHGSYPNPPPATAELMRGAPTTPAGYAGELVTPTGAAILATLCESIGPRPAMTVAQIGYGAGRMETPVPNVVRASLGAFADAVLDGDEVVVIEANLDDMLPQYVELAAERLFAAGAIDVWTTPIQMKKQRPAFTLSAIASLADEREVVHALLTHTTTLGVRWRRERRTILERTSETIASELGSVRVKTARGAGLVRRTLEYDDLARIARERNEPVDRVAARLRTLIDDDDDTISR